MDEKLLEIIEGTLEISREEVLVGIEDKDIWDSLQRVEIIFAIEEEYGIRLDEDELAEAIDPMHLIEVVKRKADR